MINAIKTYPLTFSAAIRDILSKRTLLQTLIKRDFKARFAGSMFGFMWALIQPLAMMIILYTVFRYGLKTTGSVKGASFISWFFSGVIAWNYFQECINGTTNVFFEYSYLIKKMNFRLSLLPFVKCASSFIMHAVFIFLVIVINAVSTDSMSPVFLLQLPYYTLCLFALSYSLGLFFSTLNVFARDIAQIVNIITQFGFWFTPIVWNLSSIPSQYQILFKLNPVYYIVEGYRNSLIYGVWFWSKPQDLLMFWGSVAAISIVALISFRKLRPHLADVL
jgi:teichoic acid transport system permease protein